MTGKYSAKDLMKPHSEAKVRFYQKYLEIKLLILSSAGYVKEIHIYDLYCGRGVYADGKIGSAIRAYETIREVRNKRPSDKRIVLHLNDKCKKYVENVRNYIEIHYPKESPCEVEYTCCDAIEKLKELCYKQRWTQNKYGVLNIFFIDPYGYKEIRKEYLETLMRSGSSEILLFLPVSFMHRFTSHALSDKVTPGAIPLKEFIESYFPKNHPIRKSDDIDIKQYTEYLTEAFSCNGKFYTTSYPIERNSSNQFALFFFSTNLMGFENVLHIKWQMMDAMGFGFHLPQEQKHLFDEDFKQERLRTMHEDFKQRLIIFMTECYRNNGEIYTFALKNGFTPRHANDVLRELQKANALDVVNKTTGEVIKEQNKFLLKYKQAKEPSLIFIIKDENN